MGCWGDMTPTKNTNSINSGQSVTGPAPWVADAGKANYDLARTVLDGGFQPYTGEMSAPMAANETAAGNLVADKASTGNPYNDAAKGDFQSYGAAPSYQYGFNSIVDDKSPLGSVSSYMNPYIQQVLAPQLRQIALSGDAARQGINTNATQAGAYGDARHGVVEGTQRYDQMQHESDVVGQAYAQAFGSAMQNRQQDASRQFSTQQAQEAADKAQLERMRASGIDLTNLDKYDVSRTLGLSGALASTGATERTVRQQADERQMSEFLRGQGYTDNQVQFLTQILKTMPQAQMTTQVGNVNKTESQPDNTGWQMLGSLTGMGAQGGGGSGGGGSSGGSGGANIAQLASALFL